MNRRSFIKRIAVVAAGAVVVPTVVKSLPVRTIGIGDRKLEWVNYYANYKFDKKELSRMCNTSTPSGGGVTLEQALELAKMTLKDMPPCTIEYLGGLSC